jgi:hypothetical protein
MTRRSFTALSLLVLAATPLTAQMKHDDPDKKAQGGELPAGWTGRTDRENTKLADAKFVTMGTGYHVTSGPAAIYWKEANTVSGPFTASATFTQTKAPTHPEAYGLFFMGKNLLTPNQNYAYLLVRGDGKVMVKHRAGKDVHTIMDWTENAAVNKQDANGKATNMLGVDASRPDSVRLLVNGTQVAAMPGSHVGSTDGVVGLRVNHNLDVHVADFAVTPKTGAAGTASVKADGKTGKKIAKKTKTQG